jgi:AbrB family looped-hinge helix DNA binding protein
MGTKVRVGPKYQVVIPEKIRKEAGIKPGDKMIAISKHRILLYVPVMAIKDAKGITPGLDTKGLRDETDAFDCTLNVQLLHSQKEF